MFFFISSVEARVCEKSDLEENPNSLRDSYFTYVYEWVSLSLLRNRLLYFSSFRGIHECEFDMWFLYTHFTVVLLNTAYYVREILKIFYLL